MLCTNYNVGLKTGREAETTPAKKEITIDEHTARHTFHQKLYTQAGGIDLNTIIENFMYTDSYPPLRNLNKQKRAVNYKYQRSTSTNPENSCKP